MKLREKLREYEDQALNRYLDDMDEQERIDEAGDANEEYERPSDEMMEYWKRGGR